MKELVKALENLDRRLGEIERRLKAVEANVDVLVFEVQRRNVIEASTPIPRRCELDRADLLWDED